jgi:hypothetical protein
MRKLKLILQVILDIGEAFASLWFPDIAIPVALGKLSRLMFAGIETLHKRFAQKVKQGGNNARL